MAVAAYQLLCLRKALLGFSLLRSLSPGGQDLGFSEKKEAMNKNEDLRSLHLRYGIEQEVERDRGPIKSCQNSDSALLRENLIPTTVTTRALVTVHLKN